mmetsp:Transcript_23913/g.59829  ORF Transcript_23913/g.59829 Transcript_23913/m.59829 type:complete len:246 (+) Transcript_23913:258-995(+)
MQVQVNALSALHLHKIDCATPYSYGMSGVVIAVAGGKGMRQKQLCFGSVLWDDGKALSKKVLAIRGDILRKVGGAGQGADAEQSSHWCKLAEGRAAVQHFDDDGSEAPHVRFSAIVACDAVYHLGCHPVGRACDGLAAVCECDSLFHFLRAPKVHQLRCSIFGQQNVCALHISVENAEVVQIGQAAQHLARDGASQRLTEGGGCQNVGVQAAPAHILDEHTHQRGVCVNGAAIEFYNIGVVERAK